jgi:hypothetical protein
MARAATFAALLVLAVALRGHTQVPAADAGAIQTFFTQLQRASQANDRNAIARMIQYPITISIAGGLRVPFADAAALLERYDDIFTPPLRDAIARANGTGLEFIVIASVDGQLRLTSITVPRDTAEVAAPGASAGETARGAGRKPEARRVAIRIGPRPTQISGSLARDANDSIILFLPKGRLASVRLERVPAGAAVMRVVHARTGAPLGTRTSADGRFVSGRPSEDGDYRVEVQRIDNTDDGHLPYVLSVTLR